MDYKPFLTTDENGERNDKNSYNEVLDRNRIKIAEGILDRHESMIKQLLGDDSNLTETTDSTVAYMKQVPANALNYAELLNVGGMCQKVNQLVSPTSNASGTINAGEYKELATAKVGGYHKLLVIVSVSSSSLSDLKWRVVGKDSSDNFKQVESAASANAFMAELKNYDSTDGLYIRLVNTSESAVSYSDASVMLIDLTAIYGAGNEPTSTTDPRIQWLMSYLASHPEYDAGSIITAPVTKVVSKGFNLWDEQSELGYIDDETGAYLEPVGDYATTLRSENFCECLPNTSYYGFQPADKVSQRIYWYDADKNYIGSDYIKNTTVTSPANAHYFKWALYNYGTTYNHDICINVSSSLNGTYMPYRAPIDYPIPAEVRALEGYGYGLSDTLYNYIDFAEKKYVKKVARVDLGSLDWEYNANGVFRSLSDPSMGMVVNPQNALCDKYAFNGSANDSTISAIANNLGDKQICGYSNAPNANRLVIKDSSAGTDAAAFKAAVSGVYFYYPLAVPTETDISEYLPYDDYIEVEGGGSVVFENEYEIDVPSEIVYLEEVSE